jgi:anti-anti-sigma regulatory factor
VAAECTVADAGTLKTGLAKLLEETGTVTLDISAVQRIDTAGLQVIAAFVRERESHGRQVQWRGEAPALANAARLLGLGALLKLPTATEQAVETAQ